LRNHDDAIAAERDESKQDYDDKTTKEMPQIFSRFLPACLDSDAKNNRAKCFSLHINAIMLIQTAMKAGRYKLDE
jgi:hypothetical protein